MKVRIKSGECPPYLTVGKVYEVHKNNIGDKFFTYIRGDYGRLITLDINHCLHLKGGSWEIVDEH